MCFRGKREKGKNCNAALWGVVDKNKMQKFNSIYLRARIKFLLKSRKVYGKAWKKKLWKLFSLHSVCVENNAVRLEFCEVLKLKGMDELGRWGRFSSFHFHNRHLLFELLWSLWCCKKFRCFITDTVCYFFWKSLELVRKFRVS